jgi:hypothetical protein
MWSWLRTLLFRAERGEPSLRAVVDSSGDPYREDPATRFGERTAEPVALAEILAALDGAGVPYHRRRRGFDLTGPGHRVMPVRVRDIEQVVPTELRCGTNAPELLIDLALALVPLFGPLVADVRFAGTIFVDGRRDRALLGEEAAQRIQRFGRRVAVRAPIAFPILLDLARRMRQTR